MTINAEPENVTLDELTRWGEGVCSGYVPDSDPSRYMEIYRYKGYVFAVVAPKTPDQPFAVHKLGAGW